MSQTVTSRNWREVELVQTAGLGLLCIRIDDFDRHDSYVEQHGIQYPDCPLDHYDEDIGVDDYLRHLDDDRFAYMVDDDTRTGARD